MSFGGEGITPLFFSESATDCHVMPLLSLAVYSQVSQVLLAGSNDFGQVLKYGYASDGVHTQLLKLDLSALKPVRHIDLSQYHCVPLSASFLRIGHYHGHQRIVIIFCTYSIITIFTLKLFVCGILICICCMYVADIALTFGSGTDSISLLILLFFFFFVFFLLLFLLSLERRSLKKPKENRVPRRALPITCSDTFAIVV